MSVNIVYPCVCRCVSVSVRPACVSVYICTSLLCISVLGYDCENLDSIEKQEILNESLFEIIPGKCVCLCRRVCVFMCLQTVNLCFLVYLFVFVNLSSVYLCVYLYLPVYLCMCLYDSLSIVCVCLYTSVGVNFPFGRDRMLSVLISD